MGSNSGLSVQNMRIWCRKLQKKIQCDITNGLLARGKILLTMNCGTKRRSRTGSARKQKKIVIDTTFVTFQPIWLQNTGTPQNDRNYLRILNFLLENQISLKWVDFCPIYSCPRPKLKSLQLVWPNHVFLCQYPCFKE